MEPIHSTFEGFGFADFIGIFAIGIVAGFGLCAVPSLLGLVIGYIRDLFKEVSDYDSFG